MKTKKATVLLVENEMMASGVIRCILKTAGYPVLRASSAHNALAVARENGGGIGLLVGVLQVMGMCGDELAMQLEREHPGIRILFIAGRAGEYESRYTYSVLRHPFKIGDLLLKVMEVLRTA